MYFNARFFVKDLTKEYTAREKTAYLRRNKWWIECHGKETMDDKIIGGHGMVSDIKWDSKTEPTPLTAAEIKKFRGENNV